MESITGTGPEGQPRSRVLSHGAGPQSAALLLLACEGRIPAFDAAICAYPRSKHQAVYQRVEQLARIVAGAGVPLHRVSAGDIRALSLNASRGFPAVPSTAGQADCLRGDAEQLRLPDADAIIVSGPAKSDAEARQARWASDRLIGIPDIRKIFRLGRTAAYELTHRPEFPEPVLISARCYRWWASEVDAFAASLPRQRAAQTRIGPRRAAKRHTLVATPLGRITGKVRAARTRKDTL
jgi:predicted DNA-binding transcriptional regulator AlpA